jgi:hypothetical protein
LRAHKPSQVADVHVLSTATEKEKRLARRFQQVDGALLQRTRAELTEPEFDNLACTLDYLEDFIVAQAHAPLGTASDGSALGCYLSRLGHAYVVDADHVVHDLREPLAASVLATRAKRRATEALGVQSPTPAPAFAAERADTHCTAAAWSHALRAANGVAVPLWLAVGTRSGRVSVLQLALVDHHFRLPQPAVVIDVVPGNEGSAVTALHFAVDSQHVVVGFADGSVVAFDLAASGARTVLLERSPAHNTAAVALYEHARCGLFVARATDLSHCRRSRVLVVVVVVAAAAASERHRCAGARTTPRSPV